MATESEIRNHSAMIIRFAEAFGRTANPILGEILDQISELPAPSRLAIIGLFQPLRDLARTSMADLKAVLEDNLKLNSDVLGAELTAETQSLLSRLEAETLALVNTAIDVEQNSILNEIVIAGLIGASLIPTVREIRKTKSKIIQRLKASYETGLRNFDGAITLAQSKNREVKYRYAGSIIAESRDFCRQMSGRILSEQEIRRIWNSQTWGGKRPGDPFVTRGGWRCRHSWIPEGDDRANT